MRRFVAVAHATDMDTASDPDEDVDGFDDVGVGPEVLPLFDDPR